MKGWQTNWGEGYQKFQKLLRKAERKVKRKTYLTEMKRSVDRQDQATKIHSISVQHSEQSEKEIIFLKEFHHLQWHQEYLQDSTLQTVKYH